MLEEQIAFDVSKQLSDHIDFEILSDVLISACGWTKVVLSPMVHECSLAIDQWLPQHCKGNYRTMGLVFLFEETKDATWFTLKWSN
jgi:hypothetical protein